VDWKFYKACLLGQDLELGFDSIMDRFRPNESLWDEMPGSKRWFIIPTYIWSVLRKIIPKPYVIVGMMPAREMFYWLLISVGAFGQSNHATLCCNVLLFLNLLYWSSVSVGFPTYRMSCTIQNIILFMWWKCQVVLRYPRHQIYFPLENIGHFYGWSACCLRFNWR